MPKKFRAFAPMAFAAALAACTFKSEEDTATASNDALIHFPIPDGGIVAVPVEFYSEGLFYGRGLGTRCIDFGGEAWWAPGESVILYGCNGTVAQQIVVRELDASHDVELRVRAASGDLCFGVRGGVVAPGNPLELESCVGAPSQRFAFDGDAILMGTQTSGPVTREYVIEPAGDTTVARTPMVVGTRDLSDAEYFRLQPVNGVDKPTTGFVKVSTEADLDTVLSRAGWGTVVEIDDRESLLLKGGTKWIPPGVTVRGYRKYAYQGPEIVYTGSASAAFETATQNVRVTGLRLRGPTREQNKDLSPIAGVHVKVDQNARDVIVDHLDASDWTDSAVAVSGPEDIDESQVVCPSTPWAFCPSGQWVYPRPTAARIVRNFVHHNLGGYGYGISSGNGSFILAQGNVFYMNLHSVVADSRDQTGYVAQDNFVLSEAPGDGFRSDQAFDSHGSGSGSAYSGGVAGDHFDIGWNTFLMTSHRNFAQRGVPCRCTLYHDNVSLGSTAYAENEMPRPNGFTVDSNAFGVDDPTTDMAVGDFDGDGVEDVFVGTGATWWFSSAGRSEWRFLNRMPEHAKFLRFGDFDNDGRTDVIAIHSPLVQISWAGVSPWVTIEGTGATIADTAVGDFDGDHFADLFVADGSEWTYAAGGTRWTHFAYIPTRTPQLVFGDFTADGKTDVFGVVANQWQIVPGGGGTWWTPLRAALTADTSGLVAKDFDGDGYADIGRYYGGQWQYAARGWGGFVALNGSAPTSTPLTNLPVGRFDGDGAADVIYWPSGSNRLHFAIAPRAGTSLSIWSQQDMR